MADVTTQNGRPAGSRVLAARSPFSDLLGFDPFRGYFPGSAAQAHGMELNRTENGYSIEMPVPGYAPDQIEIAVDDGVLSVSGKGEKRQFTRSLLLPEEIDTDAIGASVQHGMLTLQLRFHPKAQPKRITVSAGNSEPRAVQTTASAN